MRPKTLHARRRSCHSLDGQINENLYGKGQRSRPGDPGRHLLHREGAGRLAETDDDQKISPASWAYQKTAGERTRAVKLYDPACSYEVGDTICKEYDEDLIVGAKVHEHFREPVVTVVRKFFYKDFDCEMLEVDYTGGGTFRKHIDYMKKSKIQVMLPANEAGTKPRPDHAPGRGSSADQCR